MTDLGSDGSEAYIEDKPLPSAPSAPTNHITRSPPETSTPQDASWSQRPPLQARTSSSLISRATPRHLQLQAVDMPAQPTSSASSSISAYSQSSYFQHQPLPAPPAEPTSALSDAYLASSSQRSSPAQGSPQAASSRPGSSSHNASQSQTPIPSQSHAALTDSTSGFFEPHYYHSHTGAGASQPLTTSSSVTPLLLRRQSLAAARGQNTERSRSQDPSRSKSATTLADHNHDGPLPRSNPSMTSTLESSVVPDIIPEVPKPTLSNNSAVPQTTYAEHSEPLSPTKKKLDSIVTTPVVPRRDSSYSHRGSPQDRLSESNISSPVNSPLKSPAQASRPSQLPRPPMQVPRSSSDSSDYGSDADLAEETAMPPQAVADLSTTGSRDLEGNSSYALQMATSPPKVQRPQRRGLQRNATVTGSPTRTQIGSKFPPSFITSSKNSDQIQSSSVQMSLSLSSERNNIPSTQSLREPSPLKTDLLTPAKSSNRAASDESERVHDFYSPTATTPDVDSQDEKALEAALLKAAEAEDPNRPRTLKEARELAKSRAQARQLPSKDDNEKPEADIDHAIASTSRSGRAIGTTQPSSDQARSTAQRHHQPPFQSNLHHSSFAENGDVSTTQALQSNIQTMDDLQAAVGDVLQNLSFSTSPSDGDYTPESSNRLPPLLPPSQLPPLPASIRMVGTSEQELGEEDPHLGVPAKKDFPTRRFTDTSARSSTDFSDVSPQGFVTPSQKAEELPALESPGVKQASSNGAQVFHNAEKQDSQTGSKEAESLTPSVTAHHAETQGNEFESVSGFPTPVPSIPPPHAAIGSVRSQRGEYFPSAPAALGTTSGPYPRVPLLQKRSSSQAITPTTRLGVPGRTMPLPPAYNAAAIYADRRKLPPWERARGYAQLINELANTPSGLSLWMEASQRRPGLAGPAAVSRAAHEQFAQQVAHGGSGPRYPTDIAVNSASGAPHPRDASGASARSDMTFPMRGDGGKARDITDTPINQMAAEAMPGALPPNIPYPALAPKQHQTQPSTPSSYGRTYSEASLGSASDQPSVVRSGTSMSFISPHTPQFAGTSADGRTSGRTAQASPSVSNFGPTATPSTSSSSGRSGLFALGRRNSKRGPHPGPIAMLSSSTSMLSVTGPRAPRSGGSGPAAALGRVMGYSSGGNSAPPLVISSPTPTTPSSSDGPYPSSVSTPTTDSPAAGIPAYPVRTHGHSAGPAPAGPRTQMLRSAASSRSLSGGSLLSGNVSAPQQQQQQQPDALPPHRWMERSEPPEFTRALDALKDVLPDADEEVLKGYLRRAGGRDEVRAIGEYLSDQRAGRV